MLSSLKRVQRYSIFMKPPNVLKTFFKKNQKNLRKRWETSDFRGISSGISTAFGLNRISSHLVFHFFSCRFSFLFVSIFIYFRVDFQKDSFCISKGLLLHSKRTPFTPQKDSFCTPKGLLLQAHPIAAGQKGQFRCKLFVQIPQ